MESFQEGLKQSLEMSLEILSPPFASLEVRCLTPWTVSTLNLYHSSVWSLWERNQPAGIPEVQPPGLPSLRSWNLHSQLFRYSDFESTSFPFISQLPGQLVGKAAGSAAPVGVLFLVLLQTVSPAWISSSSELQTAEGL